MRRVSTVAVVGLGRMGSRIARRLLDRGHDVVVWNRTEARAAELAEHGARVVESPAEAAAQAEALLTMVSDPEALVAVSEGRHGIAAGARATLTVIEMSTVGPAAVSRLGSALPPSTGLLDAPVLGSLAEAEAGTLKIFVGGPAELAERWLPLVAVLGTPIHVGPLGSGAAAKLVANAALLETICALGETLALARALGLSDDAAFEVLAATPLAAQAERRRPAIESGEYPTRFSLALARKDAELIAEAAVAAGIELPLAEAARKWLAAAESDGLGGADYSAVLAQIIGS
jgi:3-hydroxyisobutyrate dehydrogenase/2-hydroxy-3-oxopropionate reductase